MTLFPHWIQELAHASLRIGNINMMAYDGMGPYETGFKGLIALMLGLAQ